MLVVRFMSDAEKEMYLSGAKMMNSDTHIEYKSTSVGFCFAEIGKRDADKWLRKLHFIAKCDWCIEFDTKMFAVPLKKSSGRYSDDENFSKTVSIREWCTTEYSLVTHPYVRIGKCPSMVGLCMGDKIEWVG